MPSAWLIALSHRARPALMMGIFIGILLPGLATLFRPLLIPTVLVLLIGALLRLDWAAFVAYRREPGLALLLAVWLLLGSPVLVWLLTHWLPLPPGMTMAMILNAAAPPIVSLPVFARLLGLDTALAFLGVVVATALLPVGLTVVITLLLSDALKVDLAAFLVRVSLFIAIPVALALGLRYRFSRWLETHGAAVDGGNVVLLLVFAIAVMDGVTARLLSEPWVVLIWLLAAVATNVFLHLGGGLAFAWAKRRRAFSAALVSGNRNIGLVFAATAGITGEDFLLYFALAQLPMFFVPVVLAPWVRRHDC